MYSAGCCIDDDWFARPVDLRGSCEDLRIHWSLLGLGLPTHATVWGLDLFGNIKVYHTPNAICLESPDFDP